MRVLFSAFIGLSILICSLSAAPAPARSPVVHPAPDFTFPGVAGKPRTLRGLRGQSVVLLISKSPKSRTFRKQVKYLEEIYEQFASKQVIFAVALAEGEGPVASNIPFVIVDHGAAMAAAYGMQKDFSIAIIGRDGNLDYFTDKALPPERVRDVVQNSFAVQASIRK